MKRFRVNFNVGKVKYLVSYSDGTKFHKDGSVFYDIATFKNRVAFDKFIKELKEKNYTDNLVI